MNRWDEGSWDSDPQRHGRFTIIADRGKTAFTSGTLGLPYPLQLFCTRYGGCTCGRKGCFETYCSATALIREARKAMDSAPESLLWQLARDKEQVNGKLIFHAYKEKDPATVKVVTEFLEYLGDGVVSLVNIFQPEVLAIGGGLAGAGEASFSLVREILDREDYARGSSRRTRLVKARLGNDAGIIGAAMLNAFPQLYFNAT